jgi:hypothetical protein
MMVKVEIGKKEVVFKLEGAQKFLAVKSSVRIPFKKIAGVSTEKAKPLWLAGRVGTHLPGVFMAGTFWTRQGKTFYYVKDRSKCVTLNLKNHQYKKVVFQVKNKEFVALRLKEAIESHRS